MRAARATLTLYACVRTTGPRYRGSRRRETAPRGQSRRVSRARRTSHAACHAVLNFKNTMKPPWTPSAITAALIGNVHIHICRLAVAVDHGSRVALFLP